MKLLKGQKLSCDKFTLAGRDECLKKDCIWDPGNILAGTKGRCKGSPKDKLNIIKKFIIPPPPLFGRKGGGAGPDKIPPPPPFVKKEVAKEMKDIKAGAVAAGQKITKKDEKEIKKDITKKNNKRSEEDY